MQVTARLRNLRTSPKKVRLVINLIRGLNVHEAQKQLSFLNKRSAKDILKLLNSAVADGENNFGLKKNNLFIKEIRADGGITIKRWRPRAFGRAGMIRKRTSHVNLILDERVPTSSKNIKKVSAVKPKVIREDESSEANAKEKIKIDNKTKIGLSDAKIHDAGKKGFTKKIFQRKAT